ncbi:MAG TPA: hypothetical protein VNK95_05665 [Caldilineaceae bacterium]|nr:hypothetical protein [Caldilineaceae bacterium]
MQALLDYGPRYARVLSSTGLAFQAPTELSALAVVERLQGDSTTDFGAPSVAPTADAQPLTEDELQRLQTVLAACWQALDAAAEAARGKALRKGPRGGGRELDKILHHVLEAEAGYLSALGWKLQQDTQADLSQQAERTHQAVLDALAAAARGEIPPRGPRGGLRWTPRYFVRRAAWHVLDHAWEIEDRAQ